MDDQRVLVNFNQDYMLSNFEQSLIKFTNICSSRSSPYKLLSVSLFGFYYNGPDPIRGTSESLKSSVWGQGL